ncbi:MAG: RnfABCDGE type electron transport complex subunit D [Oscillospiraceae bacterium]|nr:RnfABCDGE type electron transport complex subunit D [Oscillospiraceae bacterium]
MNNYLVEPAPHIKSKITTQKIMLHVIIAMFPAVIAATVIYGPRALLMIVICSTACVLSEWIFEKITKRPNTVSDLSAVVTGILLAFNLPPTLPFYMGVIGSVAAIVVVKNFFGGIGQNFANPALTARIILMLSFSSYMTTWVQPFYYNMPADAVSAATPFASEEMPDLLDMLLVKSGCIGECCSAALLLGGIYLIALKIINPITPIAYIGTVAALTWLTGGDVPFQVLSGGLILAAFFMATDYATTPITWKGKLIFAVGCGLLTFTIRSFGTMPEGVSYSILIMNILTPFIDKITVSCPFGAKKEGASR